MVGKKSKEESGKDLIRKKRSLHDDHDSSPSSDHSNEDDAYFDDDEENDEEFERTVSKFLRTDSCNSMTLKRIPLSDRPSPRSGFSCLYHGNQIFIFGGEATLTSNKKNLVRSYYSDLFSFDIKRKSWFQYMPSITQDESLSPRSAHQMAIAPDCPEVAFLFGGEYGSRQDVNFMQYKDLWSLDLSHTFDPSATATWSRVQMSRSACCPNARSGHRLIGWRHYLLLFGGYVDSGRGQLKYLNDLWIFDINECIWMQITPIVGSETPSSRSGCVFLNLYDASKEKEGDPSFLLYGGFNGQRPLNDAWHLSVVENQGWQVRWSFVRSLSTSSLLTPSKSGISGVSLGDGHVILVGGVSDSTVTEDLITGTTCHAEIVTIERGKTVKGVHKDLLTVPRFNASVIRTSSPNEILIIGGILEVEEDQEIILDDIISLNVSTLTSDCLQSNSSKIPDLTSSREISTDESSSESESSDHDSEKEIQNDSELGHPKIKRNQTLRDYFNEHYQYWLSIGNEEKQIMDDKERRRIGFETCRTHFESFNLS